MQGPVIIPPGYETAVMLFLLAVVAALGLCLAAVWMQFQRLEAQQRQLSLRVNAQLRDQFSVFNAKLSGQIGKFRRDLEGTEQKLEDSFRRKMEVLEALSAGLKLLERRLGRFADTRSASGFLADLKEDAPVFEILAGGKKPTGDAAPSADSGQEHLSIEKTSAGSN